MAGVHDQAAGRARAKQTAATAETAATAAPVAASNHQWFAVATTTNVTSTGYAYQSAFTAVRRAMAAIGTPSISANATCIDGTAANGL